MKIIKKNQIIIYTLALMLVTAGYLNYTNNANLTKETSTQIQENIENESLEENSEQEISKNSTQENSSLIENSEGKLVENDKIADIGDATLVNSNDVVEDYFAKSKLDRENMYSQMIESYEKIINNSNSTEAQKQSITEEITKLNNTKNSIMICENLIKTKGFDNSVVFVNGDSVSVIVGAKELQPDEIAQIQNIISRELNVEIENIHISVK
ncbi:MAG: SpoIIIAH-like family protein [Clostridia bacterium]|nr:SpoIIIAH-like family protein [Clostridia bacterium]